MFHWMASRGPIWGAMVAAASVALAGCGEARTAAQPAPGPGGPLAYLSARALEGIVFQAGTARDIRPTGKVVEVRLEAAPTRWELAPGVVTEALAYNGTVPGPTIRATEGDTLRVTLVNRLRQDTSIHWHGLHISNAMDGVPPHTQPPVRPGASFVYEFTVSHAGTFMYHPHLHSVEQIDRGLYGALIVDPQQPDAPQPAREFTMMLGAWSLGGPAMGGMPGMRGMGYDWFTINGRAFPGTPEWVVKENEALRVRLVNISNLAHPMHLHGHDFKVISKDGEPLSPALQQVMNTLTVNPGETYDVLMLANNPGTWMFHCHELHHTENAGVEPGGLIQVLRYEGVDGGAGGTGAPPPQPQPTGMPGMRH